MCVCVCACVLQHGIDGHIKKTVVAAHESPSLQTKRRQVSKRVASISLLTTTQLFRILDPIPSLLDHHHLDHHHIGQFVV